MKFTENVQFIICQNIDQQCGRGRVILKHAITGILKFTLTLNVSHKSSLVLHQIQIQYTLLEDAGVSAWFLLVQLLSFHYYIDTKIQIITDIHIIVITFKAG